MLIMKTSILTWREKTGVGGYDNIYLLTKLSSSGLGNVKSRQPIHLGLIIDRSDSMKGKKIERTKEAAIQFINWLTRRDYICLITYDTECEVITPHIPLTDKQSVMQSIQMIQTGETTNLSGGWIMGLTELIINYEKNHFHHVILLTDGLANRGVTDHEKLITIGGKYHEKGVRTTTLGFGNDFDEDLLKSIADHSGGRFYYVENPEDIRKAFHSEFGELSSIVGQNLVIDFESKEEVVDVYSDFPGEVKKNSFRLRPGDIFADDVKQILWRIQVPCDMSRDEVIGSLKVSYTSVVSDMEPFLEEIQIVETAKSQEYEMQVNEVKQELWLVNSAKLKLEAVILSENGDFSKAKKILQEHIDKSDELRMQSNLVEFEKKRLIELSGKLKSSNGLHGTRKAVVHEAYSMRQKREGYAIEPGVVIVEDTLDPDMPEMNAECEAKFSSVMKSNGYSNDSINDACVVLNELLSNAIKHGCKDRTVDKVIVSCRVARSYVRIKVKDPGPGFDYEKVLEEINEAPEEVKDRGNGLRLVKRLCMRFHFSENGSCVEAVVMKSKLHAESFIALESNGDLLLDDIAVVKLSGRIQYNNEYSIGRKLNELINHSYFKIIIDLSQVTYIDSFGLGFLLRYSRTINQNPNGAFIASSSTPWIQQLFQHVGISHIIKIFDTVEDAIQYLRE